MELMENVPPSIGAELVVPIEGEMSVWAKSHSLPVHLLPMPKIGVASFSAIWRWRRWARINSFDIIHANQSRVAFYAGIASLGLKTKVVFHCRIAAKDGILDRILQWLADAIICNSRAIHPLFGNIESDL
jgi:hypothetical protein